MTHAFILLDGKTIVDIMKEVSGTMLFWRKENVFFSHCVTHWIKIKFSKPYDASAGHLQSFSKRLLAYFGYLRRVFEPCILERDKRYFLATIWFPQLNLYFQTLPAHLHKTPIHIPRDNSAILKILRGVFGTIFLCKKP